MMSNEDAATPAVEEAVDFKTPVKSDVVISTQPSFKSNWVLKRVSV